MEQEDILKKANNIIKDRLILSDHIRTCNGAGICYKCGNDLLIRPDCTGIGSIYNCKTCK